MKKLLILTILAGSFFFLSKPVKASHIAGMEITYQCIGGNDYIITLSFYRFCGGMSEPSSTNVAFNCSSNSQFNFNVTLQKKSGPNGLEVTPGCDAMPTRCTSGTSYGLREWVYQGQVTLPPCNFWKMSYGLSARNPNNTTNGGSCYVESTLNNLQAPCNSAPVFTNKPVTIMCSQQSSCFNHGALDPDGDSLSYEWSVPKTSATGTLTYIGGYSYTQPLASTPPVTLNAITGDICMHPNFNIVTVMAVIIKEWRKVNGVMTQIGSIIRDMQVNVVSCTNSIPKLSGMDTLLTHTYNANDTMYFWEVCLGQQISFDINGYDADVYNPSNTGHPEKMMITWNNGIPAGTFTIYNCPPPYGTDSAYANFTWTPTSADVSNIPHCFTATVKDDACPYNGSQTFSYCIQVRGMEVTIGSDTTLCQGESLHIIALADSTTVNYIWKLNGTPTGTPLYDSTYTFNTSTLSPGLYMIGVETNDGGTTTKCPGLDEMKVRVVYQPNVNLGNDTMVCEGETVTLDAGQGQTYLWSTGAQTQTITVSSPPGGVFHVTVDGGNGTRCVDSDTMRVEIVEMPVVDLGPDICSKTDGVVIKAGNSGFTYNWNTGASSDSLIINTSGVYSVTVTKVPGSGCEKTDDIVVNIIDFDLGSDIELCEHQSQKLEGPLAPSGHSYAYIWDVDGSQVSTNPYYVISLLPEGSHTINLDVGGGCLGSVNVEIIKCPLTIPNIITPNSDGHNDEFFIENLHYYPNSTVIIYNRWGKKVYESSNYQSDWDAANNSDGVYYWVLKINDGDGTELHGTVTVMRK